MVKKLDITKLEVKDFVFADKVTLATPIEAQGMGVIKCLTQRGELPLMACKVAIDIGIVPNGQVIDIDKLTIEELQVIALKVYKKAFFDVELEIEKKS